MKRRVLPAVLAGQAASPAFAAENADLMPTTTVEFRGAAADPAAIHLCQGDLVGINHMHEAIGAAPGVWICCLPDDGCVTRDSAAREFGPWMIAAPDSEAMPACEGLLGWAHGAIRLLPSSRSDRPADARRSPHATRGTLHTQP